MTPRRTLKERPVFPPTERPVFGNSTCFLCLRRLGAGTRSDEHVVPKWIQTRYRLHNQLLYLLNGTQLPYRALTIPCCTRCNNEYLSALEQHVHSHIVQGVDAARRVDRYRWYLWLGKVFYGILRKEFSLRRDRRNPRRGPIVTRDMLESFRLLHFFLQGARAPMSFTSMQPEVEFPLGSIFLVNLQALDKPEMGFDLRDALFPFCISLVLGTVGVIAALGDGGVIQREYEDVFARVGNHPLHRLQFYELVSAVFYKASLLSRAPKYMITPAGGTWQVIQAPLQGASTKPMFEEWNDEDFAQLLAKHTHEDARDLHPVPGRMISWLRDADGNLPFIDAREVPWPLRPQPAPPSLAYRR